MLGTGFVNFDAHCGCVGLAKENAEGTILFVLAVQAKTPGTGQFRKFIEIAKKNYHEIYILHIFNPDLESALVWRDSLDSSKKVVNTMTCLKRP